MIAERIIGSIDELMTDGLRIERIPMDRETMEKPHQKAVTSSGETIGISLPQGEKLYPGAVIWVDDEKLICVDLSEEDVLVIEPESDLMWARAAYNIGNMHHRAYLRDGSIAAAYDPILEDVMKKLGVACERKMAKLEGVAAVCGQDHQHGHSHSHHHHHHE